MRRKQPKWERLHKIPRSLRAVNWGHIETQENLRKLSVLPRDVLSQELKLAAAERRKIETVLEAGNVIKREIEKVHPHPAIDYSPDYETRRKEWKKKVRELTGKWNSGEIPMPTAVKTAQKKADEAYERRMDLEHEKVELLKRHGISPNANTAIILSNAPEYFLSYILGKKGLREKQRKEAEKRPKRPEEEWY